MRNRLLCCTVVLLLAACSTPPLRNTPAVAPAAAPQVHSVDEAWVSAPTSGEELDSLATWPADDGRTWLIATGKSSHRLLVYDADSGQQLRTVGDEGTALGQFERPNGVAVFGDHLSVVERGNHRVQVLALPDFTPLGSFGDDILRSPYGIWLNETEPDELEAYITDSFMLFDRATLAPRGSFEGNVTAHTDGVALHAAGTPRFPGGALYAVHDDKSVTAFDLRDVVRTLGLAQDCVQ